MASRPAHLRTAHAIARNAVIQATRSPRSPHASPALVGVRSIHTIEEAHAEVSYGWAHSYSPEALAQAVAALDDEHVGDRVNIFLARLCFRGIYFPMLTKWSWLWVLGENRRTLLRLFKEAMFRWKIRPRNPAREDSLLATPNVSGGGTV
jgi:hypothetical protein